MECRRISIKFCGGCNPRIDRGKIARQIQQRLLGSGYEVVFNSLDADFVVYLSGCTANCSYKYSEADPPGVMVGGANVNGWPVDEGELVTKIVTIVGDYCG